MNKQSYKIVCDQISTQGHLHEHLGPVYTTDHEVGPWKMVFVNGPTS
jgi:hypothetical protein